MFCSNCHHGIQEGASVCPNCGCPAIAGAIPRKVRIRWRKALFNTIIPIALIFFVPFCVLSFVLGSPIIKIFGKRADAKIVAIKGNHVRGGYLYKADVQFVDSSGTTRNGSLTVHKDDYALEPMGSVLPIRYFDSIPFVSLDLRKPGLKDWVPWALLLAALFVVPGMYLSQTLKRKKILENGTIYRSTVTACFEVRSGRRNRMIYVTVALDGEAQGKDPAKTRTLPGRAEVGSTLWVLDDGSPKGTVIFDRNYEWECVP
ncbi:MAG TPA: zinc ribbon domain-containing protein [bacterium]|jgi:hypothetical protein|nr:zinc ribbon domain-containing protein [bacterium]